jgi:hypothetical protein
MKTVIRSLTAVAAAVVLLSGCGPAAGVSKVGVRGISATSQVFSVTDLPDLLANLRLI